MMKSKPYNPILYFIVNNLYGNKSIINHKINCRSIDIEGTEPKPICKLTEL